MQPPKDISVILALPFLYLLCIENINYKKRILSQKRQIIYLYNLKESENAKWIRDIKAKKALVA